MNNKFLGITTLALITLLLAGAVFATDPAGCYATGVGISLTAFRADGTTPIAAGSVESGELIKYQATLSYQGFPNCNYQYGTLTITTPDEAVTDVSTSVGGIPLIQTGAPFVSALVPYTVSESDVVSGKLPAHANYTGGTSWLGTGVTPVSATTPSDTPYNDVSLLVTKIATPTSAIPYTWTIDKSVSPAAWNLFEGDSAESQYTIAVTKTAGTQTYSVSGTITVHNPAQFASAHITGVTDSISDLGSVTVSCPVSFPYDLAHGADLVCTYNSALPDSTTRTNTAVAATTGDVGGDDGTAGIDFTNVVPSKTYDTIHVTDPNWGTGSQEFSASGSFNYPKTFDCSGISYTDNYGTKTVGNTATITETAQSDSASVTVDCYELTVAKTANTTFDRQYNWTINKSADRSSLNLAPGETYLLDYDVVVNSTTHTDTGWAVSGTITVHNPAPMAATLNSVTDAISGVGAATVDCGQTFPYTLAASGNIICNYSATLPNATGRTNTGTATQQNYSHPYVGSATASGTTPYSGTASVTIGSTPTTTTDECIEVTDTYAGTLGTVCIGDTLPKTFTYSRTIGPYTDPEGCGEQQVDNTATFTANDTSATGSDSWTVLVYVDCTEGCTLTQGYWKTHSEFGKAPYDDTWADLNGTYGASTIFYKSGQSWYTVFWTPPKGNVYYNLAHQYMAAKLNTLNGAGTPTNVATAMSDAVTLLNKYTPAEVAAWKGKTNSATRAKFLYDAGILGSYNEGFIGPGHCDEDSTSAS